MRGTRGRRRTSLAATLTLSLLLATMLALTVRSLQRSRHVDLLRDSENQPRYNERLAAQMDLPKKFVSEEKRDNLHEMADVEKTQSKLQPTATQSGFRTARKGMDGTQNTGEDEKSNLEESSNSMESQLNRQKVEDEEEEEGVVKKEGTELEKGNVAGGTVGSADRKEEGVDETEEEEIDKEIDQRTEEGNQHAQIVQGAKSGKDAAEEEDLDREEEYYDGMGRSGNSKGGSEVDEDGADLNQQKEAEKENLDAKQDWEADKQRDKSGNYFEDDEGQNTVTEQANNEEDGGGEGGEMGRASQMKDNEDLQGSQNALDRNFDSQAIKAGIDSKGTSGHQQPHWQLLKDNGALDGQQEENARFATAMGEKASDSAARMGQAGESSAIAIGEEREDEASKRNDGSTFQDKTLEDYYDEQYEEHYEDANNGFMKRKKRLEDEEAAYQAQAAASGNESEINSLDPEKLAKQQEEFDAWIKEQEARETAARSQVEKGAAENEQVEMKPMGNDQSKPINGVEVDEYDHYDPADENEAKAAANQILPHTQNAKDDKLAANGGVTASQNDVIAGRKNGDRMGAFEIAGSERSVADTTGDETREQSNVQVETSGEQTGVTNVGGEEEDENEGFEEDLQGVKEYVEI